MNKNILLTATNSKLAKLIKENFTNNYTCINSKEYDLSTTTGIAKLTKLIEENNFDIIIHLASDFKKKRSVEHLKKCLTLEVVCTTEIIRVKNNAKVIVFNSNNIEGEVINRFDYAIAKASLRESIKLVKDENVFYYELPVISEKNGTVQPFLNTLKEHCL